MDLAKIARNAAAVAMRVAGNAKTTATLHSNQTDNAFNWATDASTPSGGATTTVEGIKYDLKQTQGTGATSWMTEFIFEGVNEPSPGLDEADWIEIAGDRWEIVVVKRVPTDAVVILGLRGKSE